MKNNVLSVSSLNTRRLVTCGILCALSVTFMLIGAITDILDLSMMMLATLCVAFPVIEIDVRWAWLVWGVTAALSLLLLPKKEIALLYLLGGMYPIAKSAFERLHPVLSWTLKLSMFNTVQLFYILLAQKILGLSGEGYEFVAGAMLLNNLVFLIYDFALTVFISFYLLRLRKRLHLPRLR
ncbi:MAG: hypothetical protein ACI3XP_08135 [Eubacteriales bacterium]